MTNGNIQSLQLLRNNTLFKSKTEAASGLTSGATQDGVIKLARYQENGKIKTIFGIYHATEQESGYTIYDGDSEVIKDLQNKIGQLQTATGNVASQISEAIEAEVANRNSAIEAAKGANSAYTDTQITALKGGASSGYDTLKGLEDKIKAEATDREAAITQAGKDASGYTDNKISELNASGIADNQVVTNVAQTHGKITSTGSSLGSVQLGAYTANTGATGEIASDDTLAAALNKITNKINTTAAAHDIKSNGKTINVTTSTTGTNIDVNIYGDDTVLGIDENGALMTTIAISSVTPSSDSVKEEYQLVGKDGAKLGNTIKIYKDSALLSVALLHASGDTLPTYNGTWHDILPESGQSEANLALCYAYSDVSGKTQVVAVPVGSFLRESEFKNGLQVVGGQVSVKQDTTSESFLTVSNNGIKLSGVQTAIDNAKQAAISEAGTAADSKINDLNATITGTGAAMNVVVAQAAGKITAVTVNDSNVATKKDVADAITSATSATTEAIKDLNGSATGTSTAGIEVIVSQSEGRIASVTVSDGNVATKDEVASAKEELQDKIDAVSGAVSSVTSNAITAITSDGSITTSKTSNSVSVSTNASQISMNDYVKATASTEIAASDKISGAIGKLEYKADNNTTAIQRNKLTDASEGAIILGQPGDSGTSIKLGTLDAGIY